MPIARAEHVVSFSSAGSNLVGALELAFATSSRYAGVQDWRELSQLILQVNQPSSDLVIVDLPYAKGAISPSALGKIREQWLRDGGVLLVRVHKAPARGLQSRVRELKSALITAGFSAPKCYFVAPSLAEPSEFIPQQTSAILAWDTQFERTALRQAVRNVIISAGLRDWLFEDAVVFAKV